RCSARLKQASDAARILQSAAARRILAASEACFSLAEHLACVERRVVRLRRMDIQSDLDRQAEAFVRDELEPAWIRIRYRIDERAGDGRGALPVAVGFRLPQFVVGRRRPPSLFRL